MSPLTRFILACTLSLASVAVLPAADYYVAPPASGGNDSNSGTLAAPFATIQRAANAAVAGDTIFIRAGTYRETVRPPRSGTAVSPITYRNYENEIVTINGTDVLSSAAWTLDSGSIYHTPLAANFFTSVFNQALQVFVNGEPLTLAKWPNTTTETNAYPVGIAPPVDINHPAKAVTSSFVSKTRDNAANLTTAVVTDTSLPPRPAGFYDGAEINFQPNNGGWSWLFSGVVTQVPANSNQITFTSRSESGKDFNQTVLDPASRYYLFNKKEFLDTPGEWWHDRTNNRLFLWAPASDSPASHVVEVKKREFAFNLDSRNYITIQGLRLFACTISTDTASGGSAQGYDSSGNTIFPWRGAGFLASSTGVIIDGIEARYLNHFTDVSGHFFLQWGTCTGIVLSGTGHTIRNSLIEKTAGNGIALQGNDHTVFNNTLFDIAYAATDAAAINTVAAGVGTDHVISYNTIRRTGRSGITPRSFANSNAEGGQFIARINHNVISDFGLQDWDAGGLYVAAGDGKFLRIDHNIVSEGRGFISAGIYIDYSKNFIIHHNVVWNVEWGIKVHGQFGGVNNTLVYNNTASVRNLSSTPYGPFAIGNGSGTNVGTVLRNNLLSLVAPPASPGYDDILGFGSAETANNLSWTINSSSPTDPRFVAPALTINATGVDYQLKASAASIDAGSVIGSYARDGITVPAFPDTVIGSAPDVGAYEFGVAHWLAGANVNACAPPQFSQPPGSYTSQVNLALSTSTPGATIRYTVDGSTPTASTGLLYTAPFTLSSSTTVRALATAPGLTASSVVSGLFEINPLELRGNTLPIAPSDTTPQLADHTDFGSVESSFAHLTRTFTLSNLSNASVTLTGSSPVTLTGSSDFTVLEQPALVLAAGASTTFRIRFAPTSASTVNATARIAQASLPGGTYDFAIRGTGLPGQPTLSLSPPSLVLSRPAGSTTPTELTLSNTGRAPLTWSLSAPPSAWLSTPVPASGTIAPGASSSVSLPLNTSGLVNGQTYATTLTLLTNDLTAPTTAIPLSLTISLLPVAPSNLRLSVNSSTELGLTWDNLATGSTGFKVERSPNGSTDWTQIALLPASSTTYFDSGLPAGALRHYRVRSTSASGDSLWSAIVTNAPSAPAHFIYQPFADSSGSNAAAIVPVPGILSYSGGGNVQDAATLSYPGLANSGRGFQSANGRFFMTLNTALPALAPYVSGGRIGGTGSGVLYVSWLARNINAQEANAVEFRTGTATDNDNSIVIGTTFGNANIRAMSANALNGGITNYADSALPPSVGTDLYVAKFTFGAGATTRVDVFVNQTSEGTPTVTTTGYGQFNVMGFARFGSRTLPAFDEIRFAPTFAAALLPAPVQAPPTLSTIAPAQGPAAGGTSVTLSGTGFSGVLGVTFGGVSATSYSVISPTQITAVAPARAAGTFHVAVTTLGGTATLADSYTYTSLTPLQAWFSSFGLPTNGTGDGALPADPDGDGVANLIEYALGGIPTSASSAPTLTSSLSPANTHLRLSFLRARSDVTYFVEGSSDLTGWSDISYTPVAVGQMQMVQDTVDITTATPPRRFLRLRVRIP